MSAYSLNRLNTRTIEAVKTMMDLQYACSELILNPEQKAVNKLIVAIEAYKMAYDGMMNQVAAIVSNFDETEEIQGVRDKNGIRLNG